MRRSRLILTLIVLLISNSSYAYDGKTYSSVKSLSVDPSSGTASFPVQIDVPAGRGGIQPNVSLIYNSGGSNGIAGVGWILELGRIERSLKKGVPQYNDATDMFILKQSGSSQDLTPIGNDVYQAKQEGSFMNFVHDTANNRWIVTDKKGVKYFFGQGNDSRIINTDIPSGMTFSWLLDRVEDLNGNYLTVNYIVDTAGLANYLPHWINYTGNTSQGIAPFMRVAFNYASRPDTIYQWNTGLNYQTTKRLTSIEINTLPNNDLIRRYEFDYDNSSDSQRSRLVTIKHVGADGISELPQTDLTYSKGLNGLSNNLLPFPGTYLTLSNNVSALLSNNAVRFMDMNGDGLTDMVSTGNASGTGGVLSVSLNTGGDFAPATTWANDAYNAADFNVRLVDLNGDGLLDMIRGGGTNGSYYVKFNNGSNGYSPSTAIAVNGPLFALSSGYVQFVDMNGDGYTDMLEAAWGNPQYKIYYNQYNPDYPQAISFGGSAIVGNPLYSYGYDSATNSPTHGFDNPDINLLDINSDGLLDVLFSDSPSTWHVWINNGVNGFDSALSVSGHPVTTLSNGLLNYADMNGDGLTDIVLANANAYQVWMNKGRKANGNWYFDNTPMTMANSPSAGTSVNGDVRVVDMNGDGFTDVLMGSQGTGNWYVYLNDQNNGFVTKTINPNYHPNTTVNDGNFTLADIDGDFKMDFVFSVNTPTGPQYQVWKQNSEPETSRVDVLTGIDNNQGATTSLTYKNTLIKNLGGPGFKTAMSTMLFNTVKESTTSVIDPLNPTQSDTFTTHYDYQNGIWDISDKEFRGFGMVRQTNMADNSYVETEFDQSDELKGRPIHQKSYIINSNSAVEQVAQTDNTWTSSDLGNGVNFVYLDHTESYQYQNNARIKATKQEFFYQESPQRGDLTKTISYGEVDVNTLADVGTDKKTIESDFVHNATNNVLSLPSEVRVKDNNDQLIRKSWFYYDNNATPTATPGIGQLTKKEEWLPTTANPNPSAGATDNPKTTYTYDATGNLLSTTDALNHTTSITYDTNYKVFPKATTNAMNHQVQNEYYGINGVPLSANGTTGVWGQLKSSTDPNNQVGTKIYDTFGRTVKSVGPMDTVSQPTSESVYTLNSHYSKLRRKARLNNGAAGTVDVVEYFDGLGRSIQTKQKSGTAGQYIVGGQVEYDANGRVIKKYIAYFTANDLDTMDPIDPNKPHSTITYDDKGRVIRSTNPDGTYATIEYDGWTTTTIDENGHKQKSYADSQGRLIKKEEYLGADGRGAPTYPQSSFTLYATTQYVYDADGNLTQVIDDHNNITTVNYDKLGRKTSMVDPDMGVWSYEYDANGNLKRQTDAQSKVLEFNYDAINRLDTKDSPITVNTDVTYQYDNAAVNYSKGRLTQAAYFDHTNFNYDPIGRETSSIKTIDGVNYTVNRTYDALDRLKNVQYPDGTHLYYAYNDAGQVVAVAPSALTNTTWTSGTPAGTVVSAPYTHYKLNDNASTTTVADTGTGNHNGTASVVSSLLSEVNGKINRGFKFNEIQISNPPNPPPPSQYVDITTLANAVKTDTTGTISFWVKPDGTDAGDAFAFSNSNNIDASFELNISSSGNIEVYVYGNINGAVQRYIDRSYATGIPSLQWTMLTLVQDGTEIKLYVNGTLQSPNIIHYNSNQTAWFGAITSGSINNINNGYLGKLNIVGEDDQEFPGKIDDFRYYSNQALTATQVAALYNAGNGTEDEILTTPAVPAGSTSTGVGVDAYITNVSYNASGQITSIVYGNGTQTNYTYDPINQRLTHLLTSHISPFTLIQDLQYTYDPVGNILTIVDNVNTGSQTFAYDALNRLITATGQFCSPPVGSTVPSTCTKAYQYDTIGNIIQKDGKTYTYGQNGSGPHAVTSLSDGSTFAYDANGNMAQKIDGSSNTKWDYEYNLENRLTKVYRNGSLLMEYEYDGDGGRVKRVDYSATVNDVVGLAFASDVDIAPTVTYYVGSLFEKDTANALETKYIYFGSQRIASVDNKGCVRYLLGDHLGSTNVVLDAKGTATELIEYEPYGDFSRHQYFGDPSDTAHHYFTAQRFESQIGLYDYNARFYDPKLGRFTSPDLLVSIPGNPQEFNRYSYASNNPINAIDPTGHSWFKKYWGQLASAVVGLAAFAMSGFNPLVGMQAYSIVNSIISGAQAIAAGANPLRILGSVTVGMAIGLGTADFIGGIANLGVRVGAFAIQGAAIGAAGAAITGGDLEMGAAFGAGTGAVMGLLSSQQMTNYRNHNEFVSDKTFSNTNSRVSDLYDSIADQSSRLSGETSSFELISGEGHTGMSLDGNSFGKYPDIGDNSMASWALGKSRPGVIKGEDGFFVSGALGTSTKVNTFQMNRIIMQANNPGTFALAPNCAQFALDTSRFIGMNVPSNLTTFGITNPAKVSAWLAQPASAQENSFRSLISVPVNLGH